MQISKYEVAGEKCTREAQQQQTIVLETSQMFLKPVHKRGYCKYRAKKSHLGLAKPSAQTPSNCSLNHKSTS